MSVPAPHILELIGPEPDRVLRRAPGETGAVDVYEPRAAETGLLVIVHGGFWRAAYDRRHLRPLAAALAGRGWLVALPEYRRVGDRGGGWPGTRDDVAAVAAAVPAALGRRAGEVTLVGHSAGGHLAALAALAAEPPRAVVSLAGVLDLTAAHRDRLSGGAVAELLTGDPAADPAPELLAEADPLRLPLPDCELVAIHGERDDEVPAAYSEGFAARDPRIRLVPLRDADHYDLIDPRAPAFGALLAALPG